MHKKQDCNNKYLYAYTHALYIGKYGITKYSSNTWLHTHAKNNITDNPYVTVGMRIFPFGVLAMCSNVGNSK